MSTVLEDRYIPRTYVVQAIDDRREHTPPKRPVKASAWPTVRFWASNLDGGLNLIQGTLKVGDVTIEHRGDITEYTLTGNLYPPIEQHWLPNTSGVDGQPQPATQVDDDLVSAEVDINSAGFEPLGWINPEDLEIRHDVDVVRTWGGEAVKTVQQSTSVEFSTCQINRDVMLKLFGPGHASF